MTERTSRRDVTRAKRIVVKVGTSTLTRAGVPRPRKFSDLAEQLARLTEQGKKPSNYLTVDTGLRSFQDWYVDQLVAFCESTGCAGFSFDHWWTAYKQNLGDVSSVYQQWHGCRRILENLRGRMPHVLIDGRQQYHHFGTWTWLAGKYPHQIM